MLLLRCLVALACVLLSLSGFMLQIGPRDAAFDVCPWIERFVSPCPPWLSERSIPEAAPWALYAIACLGLLFVILPLLQATLDRPTENTLALFIQRGRDLHERCRKEDRDRQSHTAPKGRPLEYSVRIAMEDMDLRIAQSMGRHRMPPRGVQCAA